MQIRVFTIPTADSDAITPEVNSFLQSQKLVSVEKQFVADGTNSFWSICVTYLQQGKASSPASGSSKKRIDYREVLSETDFAVFAELRTLRKELAERESVPAYALFTNEQLADMVRENVTTKASLGKITGVGEARVEKYGDTFLQKLNQLLSTQRGNDDAKAKPDLS